MTFLFVGTPVAVATAECASARSVGMPTFICTLSFKIYRTETQRILLLCFGRLKSNNSTEARAGLWCRGVASWTANPCTSWVSSLMWLNSCKPRLAIELLATKLTETVMFLPYIRDKTSSDLSRGKKNIVIQKFCGSPQTLQAVT